MSTFTAKFNVTGPRRKELVNAIAEITECKAKYKGAPTFAYEVDYFTIDKEGTLCFDDRADTDEIERLFDTLNERGFAAEREETDSNEEEPNEAENATEGEIAEFTVKVPKDALEVENFRKLLLGKESLIKKALGVSELPVNIEDETVAFPWFGEVQNCEERHAYTTFISALCEMSKKAKRVSVKDKPVDNEKYAFRCFLLRLGFIGAEYKTDRKILLRNFTGSSAFKTEPEKEVAAEQEAE